MIAFHSYPVYTLQKSRQFVISERRASDNSARPAILLIRWMGWGRYDLMRPPPSPERAEREPGGEDEQREPLCNHPPTPGEKPVEPRTLDDEPVPAVRLVADDAGRVDKDDSALTDLLVPPRVIPTVVVERLERRPENDRPEPELRLELVLLLGRLRHLLAGDDREA